MAIRRIASANVMEDRVFAIRQHAIRAIGLERREKHLSLSDDFRVAQASNFLGFAHLAALRDKARVFHAHIVTQCRSIQTQTCTESWRLCACVTPVMHGPGVARIMCTIILDGRLQR